MMPQLEFSFFEILNNISIIFDNNRTVEIPEKGSLHSCHEICLS